MTDPAPPIDTDIYRSPLAPWAWLSNLQREREEHEGFLREYERRCTEVQFGAHATRPLPSSDAAHDDEARSSSKANHSHRETQRAWSPRSTALQIVTSYPVTLASPRLSYLTAVL